ncbi:hypothetical protein EPYR_02761 [Erwinia pyrifoliae DSM 12163]|nr:hypothetical protein EJP617_21860 [Erwinia sp. Ejp617]CAY75141.1 hypothetical protein EPYR_02761 [Erwinia pyrifoliae DSM 12163]
MKIYRKNILTLYFSKLQKHSALYNLKTEKTGLALISYSGGGTDGGKP